MTIINYKRVSREFVEDPQTKLESLNVGLVVRVPGEGEAGEACVDPLPIRGMVDIAKKVKPALRVELLDETGTPVTQRLRYWREVEGSQDLVRNTHPNRVVERMESAEQGDQRLGLLMRLLVREAGLRGLIDHLQQGGELGADTVEALASELERVRESRVDFERRHPPQTA